MRFRPFYLLLLPMALILMSTQCEDDILLVSCEEQRASLDVLGEEIEDLVNTSICSDEFECRYIAFGAKPCGGPWEYLVYSTSIDTLRLQSLVNDYNNQEADYNLNCDVVSDCLFVGPPSALICENDRCIVQN